MILACVTHDRRRRIAGTSAQGCPGAKMQIASTATSIELEFLRSSWRSADALKKLSKCLAGEKLIEITLVRHCENRPFRPGGVSDVDIESTNLVQATFNEFSCQALAEIIYRV